MLRLAIAGVVVALLAAADVNGQEKSASKSNEVCFISVLADNGFFWVYEAEDCVSGETITVIGDPNQAVGGNCTAGGNGCYTNPDPESMMHFHPDLSYAKRLRAEKFLEKNSTDLFNKIFGAIRSAHRELTTTYLSKVEQQDVCP